MPLLRRSVLPRRSVALLLQPEKPAERFLGIDPSLSSTGWAAREVDGTLTTGRIATDKLRGSWRLSYAEKQLEKLLNQYNPTTVVYEDYAMGKGGGGANAGRVFDIGELGGVLKKLIWQRGITLMLVSPTSMKKLVTGKGNPGFTGKGNPKLSDTKKKALISAALRESYGISVVQNDEADAAGLLLFGEVHAGLTKLPEDALRSARADAVKQFSVVRGKLQSISNTR